VAWVLAKETRTHENVAKMFVEMTIDLVNLTKRDVNNAIMLVKLTMTFANIAKWLAKVTMAGVNLTRVVVSFAGRVVNGVKCFLQPPKIWRHVGAIRMSACGCV
jgi:hypothetical protein